MSYIDANDSIVVIRTTVSNTDISGVPANTIVIAVGEGDSNSFSNIHHIVIDYSSQITELLEKVDALQANMNEMANNMASMTYMASNVGIKVMEGYSWLNASTLARLQLPYMHESFITQANPGTPFKYPDEAYEVFNNSNSNLIALRELASTIPPYTTNTGGASIRASIFIGAEPPIGAMEGDLWWNSTDGTMYIYYDDESSLQWVSAMPNV